MDKLLALDKLELQEGASQAEIKQQYNEFYNEFQLRITNAPTEHQRKIYQKKLEELEEAYSVLTLGRESTQTDLPGISESTPEKKSPYTSVKNEAKPKSERVTDKKQVKTPPITDQTLGKELIVNRSHKSRKGFVLGGAILIMIVFITLLLSGVFQSSESINNSSSNTTDNENHEEQTSPEPSLNLPQFAYLEDINSKYLIIGKETEISVNAFGYPPSEITLSVIEGNAFVISNGNGSYNIKVNGGKSVKLGIIHESKVLGTSQMDVFKSINEARQFYSNREIDIANEKSPYEVIVNNSSDKSINRFFRIVSNGYDEGKFKIDVANGSSTKIEESIVIDWGRSESGSIKLTNGTSTLYKRNFIFSDVPIQSKTREKTKASKQKPEVVLYMGKVMNGGKLDRTAVYLHLKDQQGKKLTGYKILKWTMDATGLKGTNPTGTTVYIGTVSSLYKVLCEGFNPHYGEKCCVSFTCEVETPNGDTIEVYGKWFG